MHADGSQPDPFDRNSDKPYTVDGMESGERLPMPLPETFGTMVERFRPYLQRYLDTVVDDLISKNFRVQADLDRLEPEVEMRVFEILQTVQPAPAVWEVSPGEVLSVPIDSRSETAQDFLTARFQEYLGTILGKQPAVTDPSGLNEFVTEDLSWEVKVNQDLAAFRAYKTLPLTESFRRARDFMVCCEGLCEAVLVQFLYDAYLQYKASPAQQANGVLQRKQIKDMMQYYQSDTAQQPTTSEAADIVLSRILREEEEEDVRAAVVFLSGVILRTIRDHLQYDLPDRILPQLLSEIETPDVSGQTDSETSIGL